MKTKYFVTRAATGDAYGGPEEGGWFYSTASPYGEFHVVGSADEAYALAEKLNESKAGGEVKKGGVGMGGCGDTDDMCRGEAGINAGDEWIVQPAEVVIDDPYSGEEIERRTFSKPYEEPVQRPVYC